MFKFIVCLMGCLILVMSSISFADEDQNNFKTTPTKNKGKRWRMAYLEGGEYYDYQDNFVSVIKDLMNLGWIKKTEIPTFKDKEDTKLVWDWLGSDAVTSDYLEFPSDAFYTSHWDDKLTPVTKKNIIDRVNTKKDIDFIFALGAVAGKSLANNEHHVNTVVIGAANVLASGIIKSLEDSGYDHLLGRIDPYRYLRQVRMFHDIFKFKKMGLAFEDTPVTRGYASIDLIEQVAKERNFEIVKCATLSDIKDVPTAENTVAACFDKFGKELPVDVVFVSQQGGINPNSTRKLADILIKHKLPSFAQSTSLEVKLGVLMSMSQAGYRFSGLFYAETIGKILNGASPRKLTQIFEDPGRIAINMDTAKKIGFTPTPELFAQAEEIYQ